MPNSHKKLHCRSEFFTLTYQHENMGIEHLYDYQ